MNRDGVAAVVVVDQNGAGVKSVPIVNAVPNLSPKRPGQKQKDLRLFDVSP